MVPAPMTGMMTRNGQNIGYGKEHVPEDQEGDDQQEHGNGHPDLKTGVAAVPISSLHGFAPTGETMTGGNDSMAHSMSSGVSVATVCIKDENALIVKVGAGHPDGEVGRNTGCEAVGSG